MKINLNKAHILTKSDNTKLYETNEVIRLTAMYDSKLANALKARLASPACSETEYRKAISDSIVVVKPTQKVAKPVRPDITGRNCIVNAMTQQAYVLPIGAEFNTASQHCTFKHDQLGQLSEDQQKVIKADLRESDILRYEQLTRPEQQYYEVTML